MTSKAITTLLLAAVVVVGCGRTKYIDNEGPAPGVTVPGKAMRYNTVAIIDPELANWRGQINEDDGVKTPDPDAERAKFSYLAVDGANADLTDAGTVRAWAQIRNRTDQPIQIEVRTTFFNKQKGPLAPPSRWQRMFLQPNSTEMYTQNSRMTVSEVGYYYIEVRKGH